MSRMVICPKCLYSIDWSSPRECWVWSEHEQRYQPVSPYGLAADAWQERRRLGYVQCPNPVDDVPVHFLPARYGDLDEPLIVGLVGTTGVGKTSLLAAMVFEMLRGGLQAVDVDVSPLDLHAHQEFRHRYLEPFADQHALPQTEVGPSGYQSCLLVTSPTGTRPVVLVDIAGGEFDDDRPAGAATRLLAGVDALVFVDAAEYRPSGGETAPRLDVNAAFTMAVAGVRAAERSRDVVASVVVTKADRIRFTHPVDRWYGQPGGADALDLASFADETEDVYAYLQSRGVRSATAPFEAFHRCTMHFASATGHDAFDRTTTPAGRPQVRPKGVLRPLVAVFAMTGVLDTAEARQVGKPVS